MGCGASNTLPPPKTPTPPPKTPTPPPKTPTLPPTPPPTPPPRQTTSDFASDCVDIQTDQGTDENNISIKEPDYPDPAPSDQVDGRIKPKDQWFEDEGFNNASDDCDLFKIDIAVDDDDIDLDTQSDTTSYSQRPPGKHVIGNAKPTLVLVEVDSHAEAASSDVLCSFSQLLNYLKKPLENSSYQQLKTARAIVVWLSHQPLEGVDYGECSLDSPRGLLQYLKEGRMTYTTCYAILCRKAGLKCAIIKGHVKAAGYEPGHDDVPKASWNAVHVECGWQLVHPFWVCRALFGHNLGGWVKLEADGTTMNRKEQVSDGVVRNTFQERYFMPDPNGFIYECCADDTEWQLVGNSSHVPSKKIFLEMPYLLPPFHGIGFALMSEQRCVLRSNGGFCKVEIKANHANAHMLMLRYELFVEDLNSESDSSFQRKENMARMVFNSRSGEIFTFDIRFPKTGIYKLVIYGGPYKSPALRLCEFKLICEEEMMQRKLLPLDCGTIGWGPSPVSDEAGLLLPSKLSGLIPVNKAEKKAEMKFLLTEANQEYSAYVHGEVGGRRKKYDDKIVLTKNSMHQLVICATIPSEGEFGVSIHKVKKMRNERIEESVCNYLLSTLAYTMVKANVKNAKKKLEDTVSEYVRVEQRKKQIIAIETCLHQCTKEKISNNDGDIMAAQTMLELLRGKDKLRDCKLRRNLGVTRKTLALVDRYRHKAVLAKDIEEVRHLERELAALRGFARQVPQLEDAHAEIITLLHPSQEVQDIFRALLVLLGDSSGNNMNWSEIQGRLRNVSGVEPVLNQMKRIQGQIIDTKRKQNVMQLLGEYTDGHIRSVNSTAHSFYSWIMNVVNIHGRE